MAQGPHESDDCRPLLLIDGDTIEVGITINQVLSIDLKEETFQVEFDLHLTWRDPRLQSWTTRIWLKDGNSFPRGMKQTCRARGTCVCGAEQAGNKCPSNQEFVEGCYQERDGRSYIKVDGFPEQELMNFKQKEEPPFEKLGTIDNQLLVFSTTVEELQILSEYQHLSNGKTGERKRFQKVLAKFKENMELRRFPFDRQELKFKIRCNSHTVMLDAKRGTCLAKDLPEYAVLQDKLSFFKAETFRSKQSSKSYDRLQVVVHVERLPHKQLVNVVFMTYLLVLSSFSFWAVDIQNSGERVSIIVTFVLASMALKYVINDQLPGKSYQTWLDIYLLVAYVILTIPAVELLVLTLCVKTTKASDQEEKWEAMASIDWWFAVSIFIIWNGFHLYSAVRTAMSGSYEWLRLPWDEVEGDQDDTDTGCRAICDVTPLLTCEGELLSEDSEEEP